MHHNAVKTDRPPSIISTINTGFQALNRHWWLIVVPLLVDLFLWTAPRISPQPLVDNVAHQLNNVDLNASLQGYVSQWRELGIPFDLRIRGNALNLLGSLIGTVVTPPSPLGQGTWHIGSLGLLLGTLLLVNIAGLAISSIYLLLLGDAIRQQGRQQGLWRGVKVFIKMLGVTLVWCGVALAILIPFLLLGGLLTLFSTVLGYTVMFFGVAGVLWMWFTARFAFAAVVMSNASAPRALLGSVLVVRRWFWSAIGLFLLSYVIMSGMAVIWQGLAHLGLIGLVIAMIGSAYISAGMSAAHLVFYRDRMQSSDRTAGSARVYSVGPNKS